ncbi:MAG: putative DNA binding domain-containing protein [Saprospiraceae bacterium]|nr:putative DNA binding domain-containing protein [Saprospiraceae bacterium]
MEQQAVEIEDIVQRLGKVSFFAEFTQEELTHLSRIAEVRSYLTNEHVFSESAPSQFLFVVDSGKLILDLANNDHKPLGPGDVFGEIGVLNEDVRSGTVAAVRESRVIAICGSKLFDSDYIEPELGLKLVRRMVRQLTNYLRQREQISTQELISMGESEFVEFKATLRTNTYTGSRDKNLSIPIIKTIAAFLNSDGGTLIVGVSDEGEATGVAIDGFENDDRMFLHITSLIKSRIGSLFLDFIKYEAIEMSGAKIMRIECSAATTPAYVRSGESEEFYIRTGPSSTALKTSKIYAYITRRF